MSIFITGLVTTFLTLIIAANIIKFPKFYGRFFAAAVVYGALSAVPLPLGFLGLFVPPIGMYMVLIGSDYQQHQWVMKLCVVSFIVNALILMLLIRLTA